MVKVKQEVAKLPEYQRQRYLLAERKQLSDQK
jgi:hypothetical protein